VLSWALAYFRPDDERNCPGAFIELRFIKSEVTVNLR
jgi:hypothetical protein